MAVEPELGERALLEAVSKRDAGAISAFHQRYLRPVYSFLYYRLGESAEDAEEVVQDVFLAAIREAGRFRGQSTVLSWLYGIARHKAADFLRRSRRRCRMPEALLSYDDPEIAPLVDAETPAPLHPEREVERREARRQLREVLRAMPPDERDALVLRYVEGFSVREIATVLRRSEKGTESLLSRAKRRAYALGRGYFGDGTAL